MRSVILARVSTLRQEKEGLSLKDIQLPILRNYAAEKGFSIEQEFVFSESADQKIRTKFIEMIEYVKANDDIKVVIAYRVDRITRNFRDAVLIDELIKNYGKEVHFVDDRLVIDKNSYGRDIQDWDLKVFLGKQYINRLKEDAKKSADHKLARGEWPGQAPYGYKNITLENKRKWVVPDGIKAEVVKRSYELYSTGTISMLGVRKKIKEEFNIKLAQGALDRILKKKFYIGIMEYDGCDYPHNYDCLIDDGLYEKVQKVKASFNKKTGHKHAGLPYVYRGLLKCAECGCAISPEKKKGKYVYYKCTEYHGKHGAKYIPEEELTKQFAEIFKGLSIPDDVIEDITQSLRESHNDKKGFQDELLKKLQEDYARYTKRIERMYEDKLDGLISLEEFQGRQIDFKAKQIEIERKIKHLRKADEEYYLTAENLLYLASKAYDKFMSSEFEVKRVLINLVVQNLKLNGSQVVYDWVEPFDKVFVCASQSKWQGMRDSNSRRLGS